MRIERDILTGIAFFIAVISAFFDVKRKEISISVLLVGGILGIGMNLWQIAGGSLSIWEAGASLLPGIFLLLLGFVSREKIGYGDGLFLSVIGLFIGFYQCFLVLCISLLLVSVFALVLLCMRKAGRNSQLPFVPFLAAGLGVLFFV